MNKKVITAIIILISVIVGITWLLLQNGQISVYLTPKDRSESSMKKIKEQFAVATNNKLNLMCENSTEDIFKCDNGSDCKKSTIDVFTCQGTYKGNSIQLFNYQNNLFKLAKDESLGFSSVGYGSFIARLLD